MVSDFGDATAPSDSTAAQYVRKATEIAQLLQHQQVQVAHLLFAIAQAPAGAELLPRHDLDASNVRLCCWRELEGVTWSGQLSPEFGNSRELNDLMRRAAVLANGGAFHVEHILQAINDPEILAKFVRLIRTIAPKPEQTHDLVSATKMQLDKELPRIHGELACIRAEQDEARVLLAALQKNVGSGTRSPTLHYAVDLLRTRVTSLKLWISLSAALILVAIFAVTAFRR